MASYSYRTGPRLGILRPVRSLPNGRHLPVASGVTLHVVVVTCKFTKMAGQQGRG